MNKTSLKRKENENTCIGKNIKTIPIGQRALQAMRLLIMLFSEQNHLSIQRVQRFLNCSLIATGKLFLIKGLNINKYHQ